MKKKRKRQLLLIILGVIVIAGSSSLWSSCHRQSYEEGLAYLKELENRDAKKIDQKIYERDEAEIAAQKAAMVNEVNAGTSEVWPLFQDFLMFGDSRVYGFKSYGFLPYDRILADAGYTINNIPDFLKTVDNMKPDIMFFSYGVNDMGLGIGENLGENGYRQIYEQNIQMLLEKSPNSTIVVNSIIDPTPAAIQRSPNWNKTADLNRQIREMCADHDWYYVDNSSICQNGEALIYQQDGVHFIAEFYPVWAKNMLKTQIENLEV